MGNPLITWFPGQARKGKMPLYEYFEISEEICYTIAYFAKDLW